MPIRLMIVDDHAGVRHLLRALARPVLDARGAFTSLFDVKAPRTPRRGRSPPPSMPQLTFAEPAAA